MITARNDIYRRNQVETVMMLPDCPGNFCVKSFQISSIHSSCFDGLCRTWWHKNKEKTSSLHVICEKYGLLTLNQTNVSGCPYYQYNRSSFRVSKFATCQTDGSSSVLMLSHLPHVAGMLFDESG